MNIKNIINEIQYIEFIGDSSQEINEVIQLNVNNKNQKAIFWCNDKNISKLDNISCGTVITSGNIDKNNLKNNCNYIIVENPRRAFQEILTTFFVEKQTFEIKASAKIDKSVDLGDNLFIGENVVIEKNCKIGNNTIINHNTIVLKDTKIGDNVVIGANNTIGGVGFGYEKNKAGKFVLIPHIGNVVIENNVEIGNNNCIDRAVLGSTILKENSKIDNLVHIAHGVVVGKNSVVIANAMVGGSTIIGDNVWVAPSASLLNKIIIEDNSLVGMAANVVRSVNEYEIVAGNPAKVIKKMKK